MKPSQLKLLIKEVLREIESEVEDPKTNTGVGAEEADSEDSIPPHELRTKKFGNAPVLSLTLNGINKNNTKTLQDFIGMIAHEAGKLQLSIIHAELEKAGKIGMELDEPEIHKSEEEINAELDAIAAGMKPAVDATTGMPSGADWKNMSTDARDKFVKQGSHAGEWNAATEKDAEDTRKKTALRAAKLKAGTLDMVDYQDKKDPSKTFQLPADNTLWTDKEWDMYDTGTPNARPNYKKSASIRGQKGAVSGDFSDRIK